METVRIRRVVTLNMSYLLHPPSSSPIYKLWVTATGTPSTRRDKAIYYLVHSFDHKAAFERDLPTMLFAKVVCNLRNYYLQDQESTVKLILTYFNPVCWDEPWSPEAVSLMWECVETYTPSLGIRDEKARAKQQRHALEDDVFDLLTWVRLGGRVLDDDLLAVFRDWNPQLEVTPNAFSRAVTALTGIPKRRSNGQDYWEGFHIPTAEELRLEAQQIA